MPCTDSWSRSPHSCSQADGTGQQLLTPPLDGTILPGVTRDSVITLARAWGDCEVVEKNLTIRRLKQARARGAPLGRAMQHRCMAASLLLPACSSLPVRQPHEPYAPCNVLFVLVLSSCMQGDLALGG